MTEDVYDPYATGRVRAGKALATGGDPDGDGAIQYVAAGQLRSLVERIERLEKEKQAIADDIKAVYGEAKANGFDTKALRRIVGLRKKEPSVREAEEAILELYNHALGMV